MGKLRIGAIIVLCVYLLAACKYATAEEAIQKDIPFNVKEIIHIEKVKEGQVVFYTTRQEDGGHKFDALAVAFITGNEKDGWTNAGHNHWTYYKNDFMLLYSDVFNMYKDDGTLDVRLPVIFGKINSKKIERVEAAGKDGKFMKLKVVKKGNDRYYYAIKEYKQVRALAGDGKVLDLQGEKD